jgi:hypothetical protein
VIKYFLTTLFNILICISAFGQTKTNLEIFYSLVDSSVNAMADEIPSNQNKINLSLTLGNAYSIFNNQIISSITKKNKSIVDSNIKDALTINYVIDKAGVQYEDMFRDGLLGDEKVPRILELKGNYLIKNSKETVKTFEYSYADTISVDEIKSVENISYPFTQAEVPAEPFFSNLWEPVIAIGAAAVAVYLFFSVRSK